MLACVVQILRPDALIRCMLSVACAACRSSDRRTYALPRRCRTWQGCTAHRPRPLPPLPRLPTRTHARAHTHIHRNSLSFTQPHSLTQPHAARPSILTEVREVRVPVWRTHSCSAPLPTPTHVTGAAPARAALSTVLSAGGLPTRARAVRAEPRDRADAPRPGTNK
jgi:hypothetical protein